MTLRMVSVSVRYLIYQPMDEKIKTCTLRFPAKENPNMEAFSFQGYTKIALTRGPYSFRYNES